MAAEQEDTELVAGAATRMEVCTGMASACRALSPCGVTLGDAAWKGATPGAAGVVGLMGVLGMMSVAGTISPSLPRRAQVPVSNSLPMGDSCIPLVWDAGGMRKGDGKRMAELQGLSGDGGV